ELLDGNRCPDHETPAEWKSEENVFFRLSRYQQPLLDLYAAHPEFVRPESRLNEVRAFVEGGLKDLSVSRADLEWGIPFPGREGQTIYVWLDALTNYISSLGFGRRADGGETASGETEGGETPYEHYWASEESTRIHLIGKDILRFHAVYWPAFLLSAGVPLPTTVWAHGWWLRDAKKVSKSSGNVVRPDHLVHRFGADPLRHFLLREMVFGQDASFSDEGFIERYNSDLANDLGNTVSRLVTMSRKFFDGTTPPVDCDDNPLKEAAARAVAEYRREMDAFAFQRALSALYRLTSEASQYLVEREPWKRIKDEGARDEVSRVLWNCLEAVRIVTVGLLPVMPRTAPRMLAAIGVADTPSSFDALEWGGLPTGAPLAEPEPIFPRIDKEAYVAEVEAEKETKSDEAKTEAATTEAAKPDSPAGEAAPEVAEETSPRIDIGKFFETQLKVGTVKVAERVPKSNKLVRLEVDLGEPELRQLVAGIAKVYEPEDLVGRQVVVVANLEPAKLMGVESQGMVLAASEGGAPVLLHPEREVPPGTPVK
ncbi:MAG TPA: methionine--tRNA ligase subunit beta, partial [Thermoanaerobaculia bacterium]|nr:methionine--tRNA ligase subunit beta [Thermoanaerobaculia bacterium]